MSDAFLNFEATNRTLELTNETNSSTITTFSSLLRWHCGFDDFEAFSGSEVNIRGNSFSIDGTPVNNLQVGQPVTITDRDVVLSGVLTDGETFSFYLNGARDEFLVCVGEPLFTPDATLTVTLEAPFVLGDCNQNGVVNFLDIPSFIEILVNS